MGDVKEAGMYAISRLPRKSGRGMFAPKRETSPWLRHLISTTRDSARAGIELYDQYDLLVDQFLGVAFTALQVFEYTHAPFGFQDGIYPTVFFLATGFHGFHVIVGTIFLAICYFRALKGHFTPTRHIGFEAAAWYWHFVDVVWLFLFLAVYIWGA